MKEANSLEGLTGPDPRGTKGNRYKRDGLIIGKSKKEKKHGKKGRKTA